MIPTVTHVDSVEMIRDGGSLAASVRGSDSGTYWILFRIDMTIHADGRWERRCYQAPIMLDRTSGRHVGITWTHALSFLDRIERFRLAEDSARWLRTMREVAEAESALPASISPFI